MEVVFKYMYKIKGANYNIVPVAEDGTIEYEVSNSANSTYSQNYDYILNQTYTNHEVFL